MGYLERWHSLSARILGLMRAGEFHTALLTRHNNDSYSRWKVLRDHCLGILEALRSFLDQYAMELPSTATASLKSLIATAGDLMKDDGGSRELQEERIHAVLFKLAAFETEMSFLLSDSQRAIRSRCDRAFDHLQRSIVVDSELRTRWQKAFEDGETACERLGGVHLLAHGIWAFKVNGEGERTDLTYAEPLTDLDHVRRSADGLVLTEWKKAANQKDAPFCFEQARRQADRYAKGVLGGIELVSYRYAVVVSLYHSDVPSDLRSGDTIYRHINIAVSPRTPSKAA
jgi:hypothetical protein